jgi:hypothetical protein
VVAVVAVRRAQVPPLEMADSVVVVVVAIGQYQEQQLVPVVAQHLIPAKTAN